MVGYLSCSGKCHYAMTKHGSRLFTKPNARTTALIRVSVNKVYLNELMALFVVLVALDSLLKANSVFLMQRPKKNLEARRESVTVDEAIRSLPSNYLPLLVPKS